MGALILQRRSGDVVGHEEPRQHDCCRGENEQKILACGSIAKAVKLGQPARTAERLVSGYATKNIRTTMFGPTSCFSLSAKKARKRRWLIPSTM